MKSIHPLNIGETGITLLEVVVGIMVLALTALMVARTNYSISNAEDLTKKRSLASQACMQLMDEMRYVGTQGANTASIDDLDDGESLNPRMSVVRYGIYSPAHRMLLRQINVFHVPGEDRSRRVRVRVFDKRTNDLLAETIGFIRIFSEDSPPVQIINSFSLPGFGSSDKSVTAFLNPHLVDSPFHVGWSSIVRDPFYKPKSMVNKTEPPFNGNYTDEPTNQAYLGGASAYPDMFNHSDRYPPEAAAYEPILLEYETMGPKPELAEEFGSYSTFAQILSRNPIPLRYLINEMAAGNPRFRHSLLQTNGIFMCLLPMRNYSDAAKNPLTQPWVRAVVHPEHIGYDTGDKVRLRVYSYVTKPDAFAPDKTTPLTIHISTPISAGNIKIKRAVGSGTVNYAWDDNYTGPDRFIDVKATETVITLKNSPLRHPANGHQGVSVEERLYGMEYIPCLVSHGNGDYEFHNGEEDLTDNDGPSGGNPARRNNTARWVIEIKKNATPDGLLTVTTHLGDDCTDHQKPNLSTTYAWVGIPVPLTERFQLLGDPRHMPYADVKKQKGYNQFFCKVEDSDGYGHFDDTRDGWEYSHGFPTPSSPVVQRLNFDFPRYMEIYRTALLNSNSAILIGDSSYSDMNATPLAFATLGFSYLGFYPGKPLKCQQTAWVPSSTEYKIPDEIVPPTTKPFGVTADHSNLRLVAKTDDSWFCLPWLGELYPDDRYGDWKQFGNLPTGPGNFYRTPYSVFYSTFGYTQAKDFAFQIVGAGLATLVNGGTGGSTFAYNPFDTQQTATFTALWRDIEKIFVNFQGVNQDKTSSRFRLDENGGSLRPPRNPGAATTRVELVKNFMSPSSGGSYPNVAGILRMWHPTDTARSAWVILNGNDTQSVWYDSLKYAMNRVMSIWTFLEMGRPDLSTDIRAQPVPYVSFTSPDPNALLDNPTSINLAWKTEWLRWDGKPYTDDFPEGFVPTPDSRKAVTYTLLYSKDNRANWVDIRTGNASGTEIRPWSAPITSPFTWNVADLPEGRYVLRVEAYRGENFQHSAYN